MRTKKWIIFYSLIILFISCKEKFNKKFIVEKSAKNKQINVDSIELTKLIREVYKWHETNELDDFPYEYAENQDSIFTGINWKKYQENILIFKKKNLFGEAFLKRHHEIATTIDSSIKKANIKWRNINDGIPLWETGADNWCGCQDYPDNYWNLLTVDSLKIKNNFATFIWTWDKKYSHTYKVTAKKEDGKWKINSLDGFEYFSNIEDYDKMMKD